MKKQTLLNKIQREFPDLAFQDARHIRTGWDHEVIILDNEWVFRFPKTAEYKKRFQAELKLLDLFATKSPLPIPKYMHIANQQLFGGYRIISGRPLRRGLFRRLAKSRHEEIALQLGAFLIALHSIPVEKARAIGICDEGLNQFWARQT